MKNFILALIVFFIWGGISIFYLHENGSFEHYYRDNLYTNNSNIEDARVKFSVDKPYLTTKASVYPDNSLISNEMKNTVDSMKERRGIKNMEKKNSSRNLEDIHLLFPDFKYGKLIISQSLVDYGRDLERVIRTKPEVKITFIGHFHDENTDLDNYFEGLRRVRQLKRYIVQNFKVPQDNISAISEGESRALNDVNSTNNPTNNNRIEVLIED